MPTMLVQALGAAASMQSRCTLSCAAAAILAAAKCLHRVTGAEEPTPGPAPGRPPHPTRGARTRAPRGSHTACETYGVFSYVLLTKIAYTARSRRAVCW